MKVTDDARPRRKLNGHDRRMCRRYRRPGRLWLVLDRHVSHDATAGTAGADRTSCRPSARS